MDFDFVFVDLDMDDGTTFVCEASNTYGRDQYHVTVELDGVSKWTHIYSYNQMFSHKQ